MSAPSWLDLDELGRRNRAAARRARAAGDLARARAHEDVAVELENLVR